MTELSEQELGRTTPNADLLRRTLARIEQIGPDDPDQWDQSIYRLPRGCGTAMCFAGWAATLNGAVFEDSENEVVVSTPTGPRQVEYYAEEILGLDEDQSQELFDPYNTIDNLREIVERFITGSAASSLVAEPFGSGGTQ